MFAIDGEDLERARSALQEVEDIHSYLRRAEKDISDSPEFKYGHVAPQLLMVSMVAALYAAIVVRGARGA